VGQVDLSQVDLQQVDRHAARRTLAAPTWNMRTLVTKASAPDDVLHDKPACRTVHFPYLMSHHYPEKLHEDPFESSVLWTRAYLEFGAGKRDAPPCMIGDGVRGHGSTGIGR